MKEERARERKLEVHEKSTYSSRLCSNTALIRKQVMEAIDAPGEGDTAAGSRENIHDDSEFVLATTKDKHVENEDLAGYVARKREMFLLQYSLGVKKDEIKKLEGIAQTEDKKLEAAEKYLEESATMFDEFLKENDKNAVEAIKLAEAATKSKLEKAAEIKRLSTQLIAGKNEISRNKEQLTELKRFKFFLDNLTPQEWKAQREATKKKKKPPAVTVRTPSMTDSLTNLSTPKDINSPGHKRKQLKQSLTKSQEDGATQSSSEEEDTELFFVNPKQLIGMFTELEEQNLSLIQNGQETEETLEEMRQTRRSTEQRLEAEVESLQKQVETLKGTIEREQDKASDLEIKSKMFSYGEYRAEDQENMLASLDSKVAEVYTKTIGPNEANLNSLSMLTSIESQLEELFETIESLPPEKVEAAEKAKEKERLLRLREAKLEEQRVHQEERLRKALERAQADPKKRSGRKLVKRSAPPVMKRKHAEQQEKRSKEEEELQYFFS